MKEGERNNIQWTTEPPTEDGFYWVDFSTINTSPRFGSRINPYVHYVEKSLRHNGANGELMEALVNTSGWLVVGEGGLLSGARWLGPIPQPDPPKKEGKE
jgi:hypothetical protein